MTLDAAIDAALAMQPDRPGAGRLCQELLAETTGRAVMRESAPLIVLRGARMIGNRNGRR